MKKAFLFDFTAANAFLLVGFYAHCGVITMLTFRKQIQLNNSVQLSDR